MFAKSRMLLWARRLAIANLAILLVRSSVSAQTLDVLLRNGSVIDGSGSPAMQADIGIMGDRIVFIGDGAGKSARRVIDVKGLIVAPGFIDPHTHTLEDLSSPASKRNDAYLMQGVTTVVTGNDGEGPTGIAAVFKKWKAQGIG